MDAAGCLGQVLLATRASSPSTSWHFQSLDPSTSPLRMTRRSSRAGWDLVDQGAPKPLISVTKVAFLFEMVLPDLWAVWWFAHLG